MSEQANAGEILSGEAVAERVVALGRALQAKGVAVAIAELIDASRAASCIDLGSRGQLREALRATMVKEPRHYPEFENAFDRLFPARPVGNRPTGSPPKGADPVAALVADGDLQSAASDLVADHGGFEGEQRGERHHVQRVLRAADLARLMTEAQLADPDLSAEEIRARIDELKRLIAADIRAHLGADSLDVVDDSLEDIEFLHASRAQLDEISEAIRPLARKLAGRLARRHQHLRMGRANFRRTVRRSIGTGGVPLEVVHQRPKAHRPELFVLCDISGSVADFSLFTLTLMASLSAELSRTRSFVFVDAVDEVTDLLTGTDHTIEPWQIMRNKNVIAEDGHSDYGQVLAQFWDEVGERDLRPTSTVIVTGDGRSNHRDPRAGLLGEIARRVRRVYWFNPEPRADWDDTDSEMSSYARHCTEVFEVRNLRQLVACVESIL